MKILFTPTFLKSLEKLGIVSKKDITELLKKYPNTNLITKLKVTNNTETLKYYLHQKKVRACILFNRYEDNFIPIDIVRKESRKGKNITKETFLKLFESSLLRVIGEVKQDNYEIEQL